MRTASTSLPQAPSDLDRLLATEQRLAEQLAAARAQSQVLIAAARDAAERREGAFAEELETEERGLAQALAAEQVEQERALAERAAGEAAAFERIPAARVAAVARELALRFFSGQPA
jgi:hypothetical protein